ncbi:MAG: hypothetical protein A2816_01305 [Candidatus Yanofskybacteria bacterium RIFCSPHIGHO2_01_FULL_39_44]|nr:MAG: hypothetical protein A2816_01305 [Candidatus Yanofskybacteria bacterium RIFCSPHIGHO2_01_FULL_39_44]
MTTKANQTVAAIFVLALERFDNPTLAALNNAVYGFGRVDKQNRAYAPALEAQLIKKDGKPVELEALRDASAFEVNRRVKAGTFN